MHNNSLNEKNEYIQFYNNNNNNQTFTRLQNTDIIEFFLLYNRCHLSNDEGHKYYIM